MNTPSQRPHSTNAKVLQHSQETAKPHGDAMIILAKALQRIQDLEQKIDLQDITIKRQQNSIDALISKFTALQPAISTRSTSSPAAEATSYAAVALSFPPSPRPTSSPTPRNDLTCTIDLRQMNEEEKNPLKIRQGIESEFEKSLARYGNAPQFSDIARIG